MIPKIRLYFPSQEVPEWVQKVTHADIGKGEFHIRGLMLFGTPSLVFKYKNRVFLYAPFTQSNIKLLTHGYIMRLKTTKSVTLLGGAGLGLTMHWSLSLLLNSLKSKTRSLTPPST